MHPVNEIAVKTFALANTKISKLNELIELKLIKQLEYNGKNTMHLMNYYKYNGQIKKLLN